MKAIYFLLLIFLLIVSACTPSDFSQFQNDAVKFAKTENRIDESEYNLLNQQIQNSQDKEFNIFRDADGKVNDTKVRDYLLKLFKTKKIETTEIWQSSSEQPNSPFNLDVYIENSASMDGYVRGVTSFETAIYNLLGDFKISGLVENLNLSYINKKVTYTKTNAVAPDIQDFIEKLEPSTFQQRGGDRSVSDLKNILETVINKVDDNNLALLASDFVFSPGKNVNAQDYLNNQTVGIKIAFADKLKKGDLSIVVIQLESNFDGTYYDKLDKPIPLKAKRPYYLWLFGTDARIKSILDKKILDNIKGGYLNRLFFKPLKDAAQVDYKIQYRPKIGNFELKEGTKGPIIDAEVSDSAQTKGIFGFFVAVNFSGSRQDPTFFLDPANYRISNSKYTVEIEPVDPSDAALSGFTHKLKLQTGELKEEVLKIDIVGKLPTWVESFTSYDDSSIETNDKEKQKTFGLKYLIEGVNDAFYPQSKENVLNTLSISIKK